MLNRLIDFLARKKNPTLSGTQISHDAEPPDVQTLTFDKPYSSPNQAFVKKSAGPRPGTRNISRPRQGDGVSRKPIRDCSFGEILISKPIAAALEEIGYKLPTEIQARAIPEFLAGSDLAGQAMTGTGKTAAFAIPICEMADPAQKSVQAIILVPTRELAVQVSGEIRRIGARRNLKVVALYGGQPIKGQIRLLQQGMHIAVGTPGRVIDHIQRGTLNLGRVKFAVLDEADEMLDIGFADDIDRILRVTPRARQTALYSATFPGFIRRLINRHLNKPVYILADTESVETVDEVRQVYYEIAERDLRTGLQEIIEEHVGDGQALIFCRTQVNVDTLVRELGKVGHSVYGLHGGKTQRERDSVMRSFRSGQQKILVSTNLAARGIDIPSITHVINYDMPENVEEYVHRIGRAGRMGRVGTAVTLVQEWDFDMLDNIIGQVGDKLIKGNLSVSP